MTIRMPKLRVSGEGLVEDTATLGGSGRDDPSGSVAGFTCRRRGFDPRVGESYCRIGIWGACRVLHRCIYSCLVTADRDLGC